MMAWETAKITIYKRDAVELELVAEACDTCVEDLMNDFIANYLDDQKELSGFNRSRYFSLGEERGLDAVE